MSAYNQCSVCIHFLDAKNGVKKCKAFPEGIPNKYTAYSFEPESHVEYMGKRGVEMAPHDKVDPDQKDNYIFQR